MPVWLVGVLVAAGVYYVGKKRGWWGGGGAFTCDVESDMPAQLQQTVLAQAATQTNATLLQQFAVTLYQANYIQSSYCLAYRAWVINGSQGTAPIPPTAAQISAAQAARAALNITPTTTPVQLSASSPGALTLPVGQSITILGASPFDSINNPGGYQINSPTPGLIVQTGPTSYMLAQPGNVSIAGLIANGSLAITVIPAGSSTQASTAAAAAAAAPAPGGGAGAAAVAASPVPGPSMTPPVQATSGFPYHPGAPNRRSVGQEREMG
jgi:hypothetical protein